MRWIWLKRASKYLCEESDQKGPLIYALILTEKGLQIFMRRIWPKMASDLCVESDWKGPPNTYAKNLTKKDLWSMRWIWLKRASKYLCVESDQKEPLINALNLNEKGLQILLCLESNQKGPLIYALNLTEKGLLIFMRRIWTKRASDLSVVSDWIKRASKYLCIEFDQKGHLI